MSLRTGFLLWVCSLIFAAVADAQGLTILSERQNVYCTSQGCFQNNTITVQCNDGDYGVYRYATITKPDGTTTQLGVLCSPPTWSYTLENATQIARDAYSIGLTSCFVSDPLAFDQSAAADLLSRTGTGAILGASLDKRKLMQKRLNDNLHLYRKAAPVAGGGNWGAFATSVVTSIIFGGASGFAGGYAYCQSIGGCASAAKLETLNQTVEDLKGTVTQLGKDFTNFGVSFKDFTNKQAEFATTTNERFNTTQDLVNSTLSTVQQLYRANNQTYQYLQSQSQKLQDNFNVLKTRADTADTNIATLTTQLTAGISGVSAALQAYMYQQNNITQDMARQLSNVSNIAFGNFNYLRKQIVNIASDVQYKAVLMLNALRFTQERRALAAYIQQQLPIMISNGYTPFTYDLGTPPSGDTNPSVWRALIDTHRILYIRNNLGLTAQQVDVSYYCSTQQLVDMSLSLNSYSDFMGNIGPNTCNATVERSCTCWVVTQRASCSTSDARIVNGTWGTNTTLATGHITDICSGAITTQTAITHTFLATYLAVMADVCNDGVYNNGSYTLQSGQLLRQTTITYNPTICSMAFDNIMDLGNTGTSVMFVMMGYLQLSFAIVRSFLSSYSKILYGQIPSGVTTIEDPLSVINGTDARCMYSALAGFDLSGGLLTVNRIQYVSSSASVTVKLDGVVTNVVTTATISVPSTVVLPLTDTAVIMNPSDASEIWNAPDSELSLSPIAEARKGHLTYANAPDLSSFGQASWEFRNKAAFNHFAATATAAYYYRVLDGSGQCVGSSLPGEGPWCTVRENFAISPGVGGFTLSPRVGTGATSIFQLVVPQGSITQSILSDCPGQTLVQTNPNVATLTLSNPRSDIDIQVAIQITGDCSLTVPSFLVPKLQSRDYLIPVCVGKLSSLRTVHVLRYGDDSNLYACGNVTNITVARDTFINTFNTPDLIHVNITRMLTQDQVNLQMFNSIIQQSQAIASVITAIPQIFASYGVSMTANATNTLEASLQLLVDQLLATAASINGSRDASLADITDLFNQFKGGLQAAQDTGLGYLHDAQALLDKLAGENVNASSVLADLIALTNLTNANLDKAIASLLAFANATEAVAVATLNQFAAMNAGGGGGLGVLGPFFGLIDNAIVTVGNDAYNGVKTVINAAAKEAEFLDNIFHGALGFGADIFKIVIYGLMVVAGIAVIAGGFWLYKNFKPKSLRGYDPTDPSSDVNKMTVEQARHWVASNRRAQELLAQDGIPPHPPINTALASKPVLASAPAAVAATAGSGSAAARNIWRSLRSTQPTVATKAETRPLMARSTLTPSQPTLVVDLDEHDL